MTELLEVSPYTRPRTDPVPDGMKRCTRCEVDYERSEFQCNASKIDGLDSWCRTCVGLRGKRRRQMIGEAATHRAAEAVHVEERRPFLERLRFRSDEATEVGL